MSLFSFRDTWAEVSLDAIYHNAKLFKTKLKSKTRLMAVVKADGYGHGSVEVARTAVEAGADYLGVAFLDEALVLRRSIPQTPILVLGYIPPSSVATAIEHKITLTVYSEEVLEEISTCATRLGITAKVHIKCDTGMGRVGVTTKEAALSLAKKASKASGVLVEGIFTHFANADSDDPSYTFMQFKRFTSMLNYLEANDISIQIKHCCNSAGTINFPDMHLDMVRVGISLYGLTPSKEMNLFAFPLKQAMHLKTRIIQLKQVSTGEAISYGCTYKAENVTTIATIPIGYADGLSRLLSNKGSALVHDNRVPIAGRVCMDQCMLNVSTVSSPAVGDEVILFGGTDEGFISIDEVAEQMGTINYEVVCLVGKRVPRVYLKYNQCIKYNNQLLPSSNHQLPLAFGV
ncbi:alanine racemase [Anaerobacillus sp. CMMVII]|uniref:alanine racemase n=1 Tax=Anaerobacillus sp. CMMVII TaxID=2755588 RepID=UPI0021B7B754|nr:alanine racemase [Anaerobacillus sp. CMMVII]MCT8140123.1 alanine racemase [Anaerobacillus sp. CMMVII]